MATVFAQSKCDAGKLKEYGKKVSCLAKLDSKSAKKAQPVDAAKAFHRLELKGTVGPKLQAPVLRVPEFRMDLS